jgi:hypothetical protein
MTKLTKLIFYKQTTWYNVGDIVEGIICEDHIKIYIADDFYMRIEVFTLEELAESLEYSTYSLEYPVMELAKWREMQINKILDDDNNSGQ